MFRVVSIFKRCCPTSCLVLAPERPSVSSQSKWHKVESLWVLIEKIFVEDSLDCDNWILIAPSWVMRRREKSDDKIEASIGKVMHGMQMGYIFIFCAMLLCLLLIAHWTVVLLGPWTRRAW